MGVYGVVAAEVFTSDRDTAVDVQPLGAMLLGEYVRAKSDRQSTELRWLDDLRQYKGQYSDEEKKLMRGSSRAFVRKTRTKVKTVDARVADMLFPAGGQRNWNISPTPVPNLSAQQQQAVAQMLQAAEQSGKQIDDAAIKEAVDKVAKDAAQKMADLVHDQLTETRYRKEALKAMHDCHLYGTGILKGPMVDRKARTVFKKDESGAFKASSEYYVTPEIEHVTLWDAFPDMSSAELDNCRYFWQRHIMSAADLAELADRPGFKSASERIRTYLLAHPTGHTTALYSDSELRKIGNRITADIVHSGYEVLERWGWLTGEQLCQVGLGVEEGRKHESFFGCVWMLANGEVIRAHLANIDGTTWPYHFYHFDKDETSFFGEGLASIMRDDQQMINAATRMLLDNGALASGPMFEINPSLLSTSEAASLGDVHAWRIWLRNSQNPGQRAVVPVSIDGRLGDLQGIKSMFESNADETTAIPRYMSGENATSGAAGTASGMSMLMGAANIVIKDLITSWDEGVTRPLIEAMYRWNMKHSEDDAIKGDYQVAATGTSSLVAKEVRARQLNEFAAMTANPIDAPFIKRDVLNRMRAEANELADVVKTEQEVEQEMKAAQNDAAQAMQQQMMQAQLQEATAKAQEVAARAELQMARAKEALANVELTAAKKLDLTMEAMYAAMQAAGVAAQSRHIAPVADAMLQEAGFGQAPQPQAPNPATGQEGARQGIETADPMDGAQ